MAAYVNCMGVRILSGATVYSCIHIIGCNNDFRNILNDKVVKSVTEGIMHLMIIIIMSLYFR